MLIRATVWQSYNIMTLFLCILQTRIDFQIGALVITNRGSSSYYKSGQNYYKLGQNYYKSGQLLQIGAEQLANIDLSNYFKSVILETDQRKISPFKRLFWEEQQKYLPSSQKAFDTVNHSLLLNKLSHYGIRDTANNSFSSYLANRKQFLTINGFYPGLRNVRLRVPQGSVLWPLLFLLYINDLHNAIKFSSPFHFSDHTCVLNKQNSVDKINKTLNKDLKKLSFWLNATKIALNATKTEVILFNNKRKTNLSKLIWNYAEKNYIL